ncbi:uncharacterized protein LOC62_05G007400 [Vanrija pseudolonga]|uniref:Uncharacterized protein n=1 Tax=Vanrija pseudolonga TaxID=143232 RepID=A0AAF1BMY0_9TREE|nr:hypothetical protein LOC62_05G007400 [Vanrija pseudolonga]
MSWGYIRTPPEAQKPTTPRQPSSPSFIPLPPSTPASPAADGIIPITPSAASPLPPREAIEKCPIAAAIAKGRTSFTPPSRHETPVVRGRYFPEMWQPQPTSPEAPAPVQHSATPQPEMAAALSPSPAAPPAPSPSPGAANLTREATPHAVPFVPPPPPARAYSDPDTKPIDIGSQPILKAVFVDGAGPVPMHELFPPTPGLVAAHRGSRDERAWTEELEELELDYAAEVERVMPENEAAFLAHIYEMSRMPLGHPARLSAHSLFLSTLRQWHGAYDLDQQFDVIQRTCRRACDGMLRAYGLKLGVANLGYKYPVQWADNIALDLYRFAQEPEMDDRAYVPIQPGLSREETTGLINQAQVTVDLFLRHRCVPPFIMEHFNAAREANLEAAAREAPDFDYGISAQWRLIKGMELNERQRARSASPTAAPVPPSEKPQRKRKLNDDEALVLADLQSFDSSRADGGAARPTKRAKPSARSGHKRHPSSTLFEKSPRCAIASARPCTTPA